MKIISIKHSDINKEKYDNCILNSRFGTIYAMSWYLDIASPDWQLLTTPNYTFVMPLPIKKKFGIPYILQPLMCQQLGIFSSEEITEEIFKHFIKKIPTIYWTLQLNPGNSFNYKRLKQRKNYILDISMNYESLKKSYHKNTYRNLKKIIKENSLIYRDVSLTMAIIWTRNYSEHYKGKLFTTAVKLAQKANEKDILTIRCVKDKKSLEILSIALFFHWKNRLYYMLPVSSMEGKKRQSMRYLIDRIIAEFARKNYIIDFEGSMATTVAQFYKSFGAIIEPYVCCRKKYF